MSTGNMRRAQLVSPFGVGAMSILVDGTSVITAGLDHWYKTDDPATLAMAEYTEHDWRLEERLGVREFRLPPDYRYSSSGDNRNLRLTVPVLRFPRWCFCMYCKALKLSTLTMRQSEYCTDEECTSRKRKSRMSQVSFVTICPRGHIDDFPFDKWVHKAIAPTCKGPLRLVARGGGSLAGQFVVCEGCDNERSLGGILDASRKGGEEETTLTNHLLAGQQKFECKGGQPWLADEGMGCGEPIRGALRAAGNVYFPKVESSIYLPRLEGAVSADVLELMRRQDVGPVLKVLRMAYGDDLTVTRMRDSLPTELFAPINDEQLIGAYQELFGVGQTRPEEADDEHEEVLTANEDWRFPEYALLREAPSHAYLTASDPGIAPELADVLDRVRRVDVLRETRALRGFTRVRDGSLRLSDGKALLRRRTLPSGRDWLPAYVVKGEGLYLEVNPGTLSAWEARDDVKARADLIAQRYGTVAHRRGLENRTLSPRFVLLHTLAHLLINELIFTCGYSSASLRERLYVSDDPSRSMAGVLIYTAAGDSEGTMGGLVRMARPANLYSVFAGAISSARWCSTDPVCMEVGKAGQGPDSCNLAACHGCALLPETSCEEYNRFLDRGLVIGTFDDPGLGFFHI